MRLHTSMFTDTITVHAGDQHVTIAPGAEVDLDQPVGPGTLEQALGSLASGFAESTPAEKPAPSPRRAATSAPTKE